ncbi:PLC-like phosphodiesterase [Aspergillus ambiguus]|uniref:uncharacterized protein n=1 Tax=Aspergillus ambiguus TaxID=176160 RepID=UPI003CCD6061
MSSLPPHLPTEEYRDSEDVLDSDKPYERFAVSPSALARDEPPHTLWRRALAVISPFASSRDNNSAENAIPLLSPTDTPPVSPPKRRRNPRLFRCFLYPLLGFFVMLGIVQFVAIACGIVVSFFPDDFERATDRWRHSPSGSDDITHWPTDVSQDIQPVACHSHNDYWRRVPLFSALQAGCVGVEADIWLFHDDLYVGHTTSSLTPKRTLRSMYLDPLLTLLDQQNPVTPFHPSRDTPRHGVFDTDPTQSLVLLIDFKTDGLQTWNALVAQLAPLRDRHYLTYFNGSALVPGPVTIVGTGNTPFHLVTANASYRDIFFDAPLEVLAGASDGGSHEAAPSANPNAGQGLSGMPAGGIAADAFDWTNSYYASVSFKQSIGLPWSVRLTDRQIERIRAQVRAAHRRGLKVRYWGLPGWPRSLRNHLWSVLVREGVDILNVDDLQSATRQDWRPKVSDWWW